MATPRDFLKTVRTQLESNMMYAPGDYVVPEYSDEGKKTLPGVVVGGTDTAIKKATETAQYLLMNGATRLEVPTQPQKQDIDKSKLKKERKTGKVKSKVGESFQGNVENSFQLSQIKIDGIDDVINNVINNRDSSNNVQPQPITLAQPSIEVVFSSQLGKIKLNVTAALDSESSVALVFQDEREIRYEPEVGSTLDLLIGSKKIKVMYPGFKFTWSDNVMKILVFVKLEE